VGVPECDWRLRLLLRHQPSTIPLPLDVALYPYELVTYGESGKVRKSRQWSIMTCIALASDANSVARTSSPRRPSPASPSRPTYHTCRGRNRRQAGALPQLGRRRRDEGPWLRWAPSLMVPRRARDEDTVGVSIAAPRPWAFATVRSLAESSSTRRSFLSYPGPMPTDEHLATTAERR